MLLGLPGSSAGKGSACNSVPGSGRPPLEEGQATTPVFLNFPQKAQMVKNLPAMRETWVQSLGWKDPLEKVMATSSRFLLGKQPGTEKLQSHGVSKSQMWLSYIAQRRNAPEENLICTIFPVSIKERESIFTEQSALYQTTYCVLDIHYLPAVSLTAIPFLQMRNRIRTDI